jgi:hypothetical protein
MKTPIFEDAIADNALKDLLNEVKSANVRKEFNGAPKERIITNDFSREQIENEEKENEVKEDIKPEAPEVMEPKVKKPFMPYDEQAEMLVVAFDSIQQLSLPALAKKVNLSSEEKTAIKKVLRKRKFDKHSLSKEENLLFDKWAMIKEFEDELPFSEKEIKFLVNPLAKLLEQQQAEMKPGMALMVAAATVTLPRVAMFIALKSDMSEIGNSLEKETPSEAVKPSETKKPLENAK